MELLNEEHLTGLIWDIVERSFYTPLTDKPLTGCRAERIGDYRNLLYRECKNLAQVIAKRVAELEEELATVKDELERAEVCLAHYDAYSTGWENECTICQRAWELHDSDLSEAKETLPRNSHYYLRLARKEATDEQAED